MCPKTSSDTNLIDLTGFSIPVFHDTKQSYVDFYAIDPYTKTRRRKKYHVKARTKKERCLIAQRMISALLRKLNDGWNPWTDNRSYRASEPLVSVIDNYLESLNSGHRLKSIQTYSSKANILKDYIEKQYRIPLYAVDFNREFVIRFLDWISTKRAASPRTRNNYRGWLNSLAVYMLERSYIPENFVPMIKNVRTGDKQRDPLTKPMLKTLFTHLRDNDPQFLLAVMMEYYTFIRPNELRSLRLSDISLKDMSVYIPAEVSKNKKDGKVALNPDIIKLMLDLRTFNNPTDFYIFGPDFTPSDRKASADIFNRRFAQIRKKLKWPGEIKFYSLKDSGIRDLSEAAGIVTARDQARHHDIATTNRYLHGAGLNAPEKAKHFRGFLSPDNPE